MDKFEEYARSKEENIHRRVARGLPRSLRAQCKVLRRCPRPAVANSGHAARRRSQYRKPSGSGDNPRYASWS